MDGNDGLPKVAYCWTWNYRRSRIGVALSEQEAEERHNSGEEYTAVVSSGPPERHPVLVTIAWKNDYASTRFLDELGRPHVKYAFRKKTSEMLFLEAVHILTYPNDNPKLSLKDSNIREEFHYRDDGYVKHLVINKEENIKEIAEYTDAPVAAN